MEEKKSPGLSVSPSPKKKKKFHPLPHIELKVKPPTLTLEKNKTWSNWEVLQMEIWPKSLL
jgi:hypothetical protein